MTEVLALSTALLLGASGTVTDVSIVPSTEQTEIVISVDGEVEYRDFTMEGPYRLIVDLMDARHGLPRDNFYGIDRGGIRAIRTSQYSEGIVRVVLELERMVGYQVMAEPGRLRLVLSTGASGFSPWSTSGQPPAPSEVAPVVPAEPLRSSSRTPLQEARRITVSFENAPMETVLFTFADFSDRSIVAGANVEGTVSATIVNQPWDVALREILRAHGLAARETEEGIIRVDNVANLAERETVEPQQTQAFRIQFARANEIQTAIAPLLTDRGSTSVETGRNMLVVTDVPRVIEDVGTLIQQLDVRTPQVTIQAKIIFVNRTDLNEFGITYDLKDSQGNQLNVVTPGFADLDGDGVAEEVPIGTNVVSLGGNSLAALGNATNRVAGPTLTLLTSLVIGRHTLISFIEALESVNLSDIQATPSVTVLDNQNARILVGEETPVRIVEQQAGGGEGGLPRVTTTFQETGIILDVTPHITDGDNILLEIHAERSSADLAETDAGVIFRRQLADSRVLLRDGQTMVIAGLTVTEQSDVMAGIPLLMDLPLIGRLFRTTRESQVQRDLIILVTPHLVRDDIS